MSHAHSLTHSLWGLHSTSDIGQPLDRCGTIRTRPPPPCVSPRKRARNGSAMDVSSGSIGSERGKQWGCAFGGRSRTLTLQLSRALSLSPGLYSTCLLFPCFCHAFATLFVHKIMITNSRFFCNSLPPLPLLLALFFSFCFCDRIANIQRCHVHISDTSLIHSSAADPRCWLSLQAHEARVRWSARVRGLVICAELCKCKPGCECEQI